MEYRKWIKNTEIEINVSLKWSNAILSIYFDFMETGLLRFSISLFWVNITYLNGKQLPF